MTLDISEVRPSHKAPACLEVHLLAACLTRLRVTPFWYATTPSEARIAHLPLSAPPGSGRKPNRVLLVDDIDELLSCQARQLLVNRLALH